MAGALPLVMISEEVFMIYMYLCLCGSCSLAYLSLWVCGSMCYFVLTMDYVIVAELSKPVIATHSPSYYVMLSK